MADLRDSLSYQFTQIKFSLPCIPAAKRIFFFNFRLERTFLPSNNHRDAATKILFLHHQILAIIHFILSSPSACPFCALLNIVLSSVSSLYPVLAVIIPSQDQNYILCHLGKILFPSEKKFFPLGKIFNQIPTCLTLLFATWEELLVYSCVGLYPFQVNSFFIKFPRGKKGKKNKQQI